MLWLLMNLINFTIAQEPLDPPESDPEAVMIVLAHNDLEVYISPIQVQEYTAKGNIEAVVDDQAAFAYSSTYAHNAKISNGTGGYEPVSVKYGKIKLYNDRTIKYAWDDCDYIDDGLACSVYNSHFFIETIVTIDDNELVVRSIMYDQDAQVVSSGVARDRRIIRWIKQQEIISQNTIYNTPQRQGRRSCKTGTSCSVGGQSSGPVSQLNVTKPLEKMPLKWEIPHKLLDRHIQQAMLLLWTSARIDTE